MSMIIIMINGTDSGCRRTKTGSDSELLKLEHCDILIRLHARPAASPHGLPPTRGCGPHDCGQCSLRSHAVGDSPAALLRCRFHLTNVASSRISIIMDKVELIYKKIKNVTPGQLFRLLYQGETQII